MTHDALTTTVEAAHVVALNRHARVHDRGRTLVGGSPTRVLHLTEAAARLLDGGTFHATGEVERTFAERLVETGIADPVLMALPAADPTSVTIVVPVRDRAAQLSRLLRGLGDCVPIIVVDDGSLDPVAVAAVVSQHTARLVTLGTNVAPAGARNAGLAQVMTPYVAFVDSDVVVDPEALMLLARHFVDPLVALVAPRVAPLDTVAGQSWIARYEGARSSLDPGPDPAVVRPRSRVSWVPTACVVARVSALGQGFSADLRVGEDVDLVWRLCAAGWRVRYEPGVKVQHEHRCATRDWLSRKAFYGTGAALLAQRHGRHVAPAVLAPWSVVAIAALLCQRRWSVPVVAATLVVVTSRIAGKVSRSPRPVRLAASLTATGVGAAAGQASALLLRHWWPATAAACVVSRRPRRVVLVAAVLDAAVLDALLEHRRTAPPLDLARFALARRLDDLGYGAGVWVGAWRARSARSLMPDLTTSRLSR